MFGWKINHESAAFCVSMWLDYNPQAVGVQQFVFQK